MSDPAPTIYLTNAASVAAVARGNAKPETAACVGPGRVLSIMRWPRVDKGEAGLGRVLRLTPPSWLAAPALDAKRRYDAGADEAAAAWRTYEASLRALWDQQVEKLQHGSLAFGEPAAAEGVDARSWDGAHWRLLGRVDHGDTLICACSRDAARAGRCHWVVAARLLVRAGWLVVLDGVELVAAAA